MFDIESFKFGNKPTWFKIGDMLIAKWQDPNTKKPIYHVATDSKVCGWTYEGN